MLLDVTLLLVAARWLAAAVAPHLAVWALAIPATVVWFGAVVATPSLATRAGLLAAALVVFALALPSLIGRDDLARWRTLISTRLGASSPAAR
jgi:thiol:disulfide interchange protein